MSSSYEQTAQIKDYKSDKNMATTKMTVETDITSKNYSRMMNQHGVSLIEVLIVVVLIALMGMFAAPELKSFKPNMQLRSAARDLFSDFQNAKMAAVRENQNCAVGFNVTTRTDNFSYIVYIDANNDFKYTIGAIPSKDEKILSQVKWSDKHKSVLPANGGVNGNNFTVPAGGKPTIVFQPNGLPADSDGGIASGTATFSVKTGKTANIVISKVGNISIN